MLRWLLIASKIARKQLQTPLISIKHSNPTPRLLFSSSLRRSVCSKVLRRQRGARLHRNFLDEWRRVPACTLALDGNDSTSLFQSNLIFSIRPGILDVANPISTRRALVGRTDCFGYAMRGDCSGRGTLSCFARARETRFRRICPKTAQYEGVFLHGRGWLCLPRPPPPLPS